MPINDPIAWWRLDDGTGTTAVDSSGNGYSLTLTNTPTWITPAQIAGGLNFNAASTQYAETAAAGLLTALQGLTAYTCAFWARASAYGTTPGALAIRDGTNFATGLLIIYPYDDLDGNGARVFCNNNQIINQNAGAASVDAWHHFVFVTRTAVDCELYVDNVSVGIGQQTTLPATLSNVTVGAWHPAAQHFTGDLDDVRIYNRALTGAEVTELFAWRGDAVPEDIAITPGSYWNYRKRIEEDEQERDERWRRQRERIEKVSRLIDGVTDKLPDDVPEAQVAKRAEAAVEKAAEKLVEDVPPPAFDYAGLAQRVKAAEHAVRQAEQALQRYEARKRREMEEQDDEDVLLLMA